MRSFSLASVAKIKALLVCSYLTYPAFTVVSANLNSLIPEVDDVILTEVNESDVFPKVADFCAVMTPSDAMRSLSSGLLVVAEVRNAKSPMLFDPLSI